MRNSIDFPDAASFLAFIRAVSQTALYAMAAPRPFISAIQVISEKLSKLPEYKRTKALKSFEKKEDLEQIRGMAEYAAKACELSPTEEDAFPGYLLNNTDILRQANIFMQLNRFGNS